MITVLKFLIDTLKAKRLLYGAGNYGRYCYEAIKNKCCVVAWVDQMYEEYLYTQLIWGKE